MTTNTPCRAAAGYPAAAVCTMTAAGKGGLPPSGLRKGALPLKYITFNPGCAYAGLDNLLDALDTGLIRKEPAL